MYIHICNGCIIYNNTSIKINCLKLKSEVGMAVLKSNQTRVVYRDNQNILIVHPYACFLGSSDCVILLLLFTNTALRLYSKNKHRDVLYVCSDYLYILLFFVCFLALPSLLLFSVLSNCFFILVTVHFFMITSNYSVDINHGLRI